MDAARDPGATSASPRGRQRRLAAPELGQGTRARSAVLQQLLLATAVFLVALLIPFSAAESGNNLAVVFSGILVIFLVTGVTFLVPWNRIPPIWVILVPLVDVVAISVMRVAAPVGGFGLLWVFPVVWMAGSFGVAGLVTALCVSVGSLAILTLPGETRVTFASFLVPATLAGISVTTYTAARRAQAQRRLLIKQARLLDTFLERTRQQEQELTEVLDAVDFGIVRIDANGAVLVRNEAHARLQQAVPLVAGDAGEPAFHEDGTTPLPSEEFPVERARRGEAFDGQIVWFGEDVASRRALSVSARRLIDSGGVDAGAVVVSRDVTAELTARRARDELVASVSHELRTPLTSILGFLDLAIEDPGVPENVRAGLDIAERNAERLLRIVADILAASRAPGDLPEMESTVVAADDLMRAAAQGLTPQAEARAIRIDVSGLEASTVAADPLRLRQVIDNLIANAIAYNRDGGLVFVGTTTDDVHTWLLVRDTGIGISEIDRGRIFQRYYKAGESRRTGTGLGLAISREIVRANGGEIAVHSSPGIGTTFIVKLPARLTPEGHMS